MLKLMEDTMRQIVVSAAGAAAILTAAMTAPVAAIPLDPGAMRPAADAVNPVDKTACWRWGWHGWGWYRCWGGPYDGGYHRRWGWDDDWRWRHHRHYWWR